MGLGYFIDKILLAKSCLDKFEKSLSMLCEQLLINIKRIYKDRFINTFYTKSIEQCVLRYRCWSKNIIKQIINLRFNMFL